MCGITGYIGSEPAVPVIIRGLESLEYRGYDSSGVALIDNGTVRITKTVGRINSLKDALSENGDCPATCGIGHTRWATHGKPTTANAHPHASADGSVAIVHNGIIENFSQLKTELEAEGRTFASETDSEVIAHLIARETDRGLSLEKAVSRILPMLKGSYAFVAVSGKQPDRLVGVRQGSPLIVGLGKTGRFFASDIPAIVGSCGEFVYLEDNQIALLTRDGLELTNARGAAVRPDIRTVTSKTDIADKNGFDHFMLKEIFEQPAVIRHIINARLTDDGSPFFEEQTIPDSFLKNVDKIYIVSCGTAYHAGYIGKYLLEEFTDIPVEIDISSEFRYRKTRFSERSLMLCVSQSGETADTLACLREAKDKKCRILSVCNVVNSSIARESDGVIYTDAGPEIGVASTKAYTSQLMILTLLAVHFAKLRDQINDLSVRTIVQHLKLLPGHIETIFRQQDAIRELAARYKDAISALYLGRGFNFPTALEGALKNKEISYMHCEGYPAGEMKHGPIALINSQLPVICVCPNGETYPKMLSNIREVEARDGIVIAIATEGNAEISSYAREVIFVPETIEELSPILNAVPLQLLAYYIALAKECDIDKPRNLAKSVTVE